MSDELMYLLIAAVASALPLWKALMRALERRADQMWLDHGDDDDDEIKVQRVTDKVQAASALMSMLPRSVVESKARRSQESQPPPDKPAAN